MFLLLSSTSYDQKIDLKTGKDLATKALDLVAGYPDSTIYYSNQSLAIAQLLNDSLLKARSMINLGEAYRVKGEYDKSTRLLFRALKVVPRDTTGLRVEASALSGLGNNYYIAGDLSKATSYFSEAFAIQLQLGRKLEAAVVASHLIGCYALTNRLDSAFIVARFVYSVVSGPEEYGRYLAGYYNNLGTAYQMKGDLDSAIVCYQTALGMNKDLEQGSQVTACTYNVAIILKEQGKVKECIDLLEETLDWFKGFPGPEIQKVYYLILSDSYAELGDYQSSLEYRILKDSVQQTIDDSKYKAMVLDQEARYQAANKAKEIKNQELKLRESDIELANQEQLVYKVAIAFILVLTVVLIFSFRSLFKRRSQMEIEAEKERFFSNIIHEIRTPLSLIVGPLEQIRQNPDKAEKQFELIERNSARLTDLVNQLLDVSKLDAKRYELQEKFGNMKLFVTELCQNFRPLAEQKKAVVSNDFVDCDRNICTDFEALTKIYGNLITNAIKYSGQDSVIEVNSAIFGDNLTIQVRDHGSGIAKKDLDKIFGRFNRTEGSSYIPGVGIGLSLVKSLVDLMEGKISVESDPGKGSCFTVTVPVKIPVNANIPAQLEIPDNKLVILLAEDDPDMRSFITSILSDEDFYVLEAENGNVALEKMQTALPDVIISDVMMPGMDGIEFVKTLKNNPLFQHIPFIFLSAKTAGSSKLSGLSGGADLYLEKPFQPRELLMTVKNQLNTLKSIQTRFSEKVQSKELSFEEKLQTSDVYLQKVNKIILEHLDNADFSVEEMAGRLAISRSQLHRKIKALTGYSISSYMRIVRLEKAVELLKTNAGNVTKVAYLTGFNSQSYFTKSFSEHFGFPPSELLQKIQ